MSPIAAREQQHRGSALWPAGPPPRHVQAGGSSRGINMHPSDSLVHHWHNRSVRFRSLFAWVRSVDQAESG